MNGRDREYSDEDYYANRTVIFKPRLDYREVELSLES